MLDNRAAATIVFNNLRWYSTLYTCKLRTVCVSSRLPKSWPQFVTETFRIAFLYCCELSESIACKNPPLTCKKSLIFTEGQPAKTRLLLQVANYSTKQETCSLPGGMFCKHSPDFRQKRRATAKIYGGRHGLDKKSTVTSGRATRRLTWTTRGPLRFVRDG